MYSGTTLCNTHGVPTRRRALDWTLAAAFLALLIFVPWLRDHGTIVGQVFLAVLVVAAFVRGKPKGIRFAILSILAALLVLPFIFLAFWVNVWLGVAFVVLVPTSALVVAYRRDQRAVMN